MPEKSHHAMYLKRFRCQQCPLFLDHKCQHHRPYTCFNWHFPNQRRRSVVKMPDGSFNYTPDIYCTEYDENSGQCPEGDDCGFVHRNAGDTERCFHPRYFKTALCLYGSTEDGLCVKNGEHCAFAHSADDLRQASITHPQTVQEMAENCQESLSGDHRQRPQLSAILERERVLTEDPKWNDLNHVLTAYKTEACHKPPRMCRQGYACPFYHNEKDRRRSPAKWVNYRSTPCPQVKSPDGEWMDTSQCKSGDACTFCHTRTEQQFHPEIFKSTKCNDLIHSGYCPRGPFCAFSHNEGEMTVGREYVAQVKAGTILPEPEPVINQQQQSQQQHSPQGDEEGKKSLASMPKRPGIIDPGPGRHAAEFMAMIASSGGQKSSPHTSKPVWPQQGAPSPGPRGIDAPFHQGGGIRPPSQQDRCQGKASNRHSFPNSYGPAFPQNISGVVASDFKNWEAEDFEAMDHGSFDTHQSSEPPWATSMGRHLHQHCSQEDNAWPPSNTTMSASYHGSKTCTSVASSAPVSIPKTGGSDVNRSLGSSGGTGNSYPLGGGSYHQMMHPGFHMGHNMGMDQLSGGSGGFLTRLSEDRRRSLSGSFTHLPQSPILMQSPFSNPSGDLEKICMQRELEDCRQKLNTAEVELEDTKRERDFCIAQLHEFREVVGCLLSQRGMTPHPGNNMQSNILPPSNQQMQGGGMTDSNNPMGTRPMGDVKFDEAQIARAMQTINLLTEASASSDFNSSTAPTVGGLN